jgi:Fe-coproporphyrin III synthase
MANLYTPLKIFHFKEKIDSLPIGNPEILSPLHIRIKPTNICNHNCYYCAYRAENLQLGQDMSKTDSIPREKMLEITDDIISMGVKAITFSGGGEPLVYPHLAEVLKKLADSPVRFASLTNGSKLKGEIADMFAMHGTWVRVSMDGWDDSSYADYRNVPNGEFKKVMNNMTEFKKLDGPCKLGVSYIVDNINAFHVYEAIIKFKDIGVDSVKISPCIIDNNGKKNNAFHRPFFNRVKDQIARAKKDVENATFEIFDAYHELDEKFDKDYTWCPYCQILPVIGADQNIYPCQDKAYNLNEGLLGSIRDRSFKDFWFQDKSVFFKINPFEHCRHHCVANAKNKLLLDYLDADPDHIGFV